MQALKIAVIGGGSSYTPELIEGIIVRYEQLPVTELALVDVESGREKVEIIAALTRRMLKHKGLEQVSDSWRRAPPMSGWVSSTTCWARRPPASAVLPRRCGRSR